MIEAAVGPSQYPAILGAGLPPGRIVRTGDEGQP
jgi:hypothetical protein